jgi:Saxitoxin biosynthesis operon protein SxtJ
VPARRGVIDGRYLGRVQPQLPSNRSFGWMFTGVFALGALFYPWVLALAAVSAGVTLAREQWLTPLNRGWMKLGELLGRVVNPVVLGMIFYGVFTPVGLAMRLAGRDAMTRTYEPRARTYWVQRDPPGPPEDSFRNMF